MTVDKRYKLGLIGSLPLPHGGITTFLERLVSGYVKCNIFIDYVYNINKRYIPLDNMLYIKKTIYKGLFLSYLSYEISRFFFSRSNQIWFINGSSIHSLIRTVFLPKFPNSVWILMLHNGVLELPSLFDNFIFKKLLFLKFDIVCALSSNQRRFYDELVDQNKIIDLKPYLPAKNLGLYTHDFVDGLIKLSKDADNNIYVLNGYALPIYGYDILFQALDHVADKSFVVFLCIYGNSTDKIYDFIPLKYKKNVYVITDLSEHAFLHVLNHADLYLRTNTVDSFGIAAADALSLGKKVVASDVCERAPGCILFKSGNFMDLARKIDYALDLKNDNTHAQDFSHFINSNTSKLLSLLSDGDF